MLIIYNFGFNSYKNSYSYVPTDLYILIYIYIKNIRISLNLSEFVAL